MSLHIYRSLFTCFNLMKFQCSNWVCMRWIKNCNFVWRQLNLFYCNVKQSYRTVWKVTQMYIWKKTMVIFKSIKTLVESKLFRIWYNIINKRMIYCMCCQFPFLRDLNLLKLFLFLFFWHLTYKAKPWKTYSSFFTSYTWQIIVFKIKTNNNQKGYLCHTVFLYLPLCKVVSLSVFVFM